MRWLRAVVVAAPEHNWPINLVRPLCQLYAVVMCGDSGGSCALMPIVCGGYVRWFLWPLSIIINYAVVMCGDSAGSCALCFGYVIC